MRLALLADIHGNLPALEAVIRELERLQPDYVILNGDLINGVPYSAEVIDRVRKLNWTVVRGNHEFYYLDYGTERAVPGCEDPVRWGQLHWLLKQISPEQGAYLALLPDERTLYFPGTQPVRVAHGVPGRNRVGFYTEQPAEAIVAEIGDVGERTLVSAHTHVQIDRHVALHADAAAELYADPHASPHDEPAAARQWHVINPGSVGLPLNGNSAAQFALLENVAEEQEAGGWKATMCSVNYDRRSALAAYHETGMMEAGGVITRLFYWELVTARPEIILFYRWAHEHGYDADLDAEGAFLAYSRLSERSRYVRKLDPLANGRR
jgi:predicted phosphodiesterase